ncbi:MAG: polysaccharide deacetylase family protein [Rubrivivax sp.]|nr:polysaccharide deacetylase family protein [Rubrivivax sp.]
MRGVTEASDKGARRFAPGRPWAPALRRAAVLGAALASLGAASASLAAPCDKPVYLTFDTGHMAIAPLVADVLKRHEVRVTFFLANERTRTSGTSLDDAWAAWWRERAAEGHAFGSHTWDHDVWQADLPENRFRFKPTQGPQAQQPRVLGAAAYCAELQRPAARFEALTGQPMGAVFRAPGGKTSPALLKAASRCGWTHVPWTPAGFLGDELPSDRFPNAALLNQALRDVKAGDILLAHLGIWSRRDPWAPAVLEPLIVGLKARGLCFATLREHPLLGAAARSRAPGS